MNIELEFNNGIVLKMSTKSLSYKKDNDTGKYVISVEQENVEYVSIPVYMMELTILESESE
jgi:hypothetical protein